MLRARVDKSDQLKNSSMPLVYWRKKSQKVEIELQIKCKKIDFNFRAKSTFVLVKLFLYECVNWSVFDICSLYPGVVPLNIWIGHQSRDSQCVQASFELGTKLKKVRR